MDSERMPKEQDALADDVMDSMGEPQNAADGINQSHESAGAAYPEKNSGETLAVQKRLKQVRRAHDREIREMQSRIESLQSQLSQGSSQNQPVKNYAANGMQSGQMGLQQPAGIDDIIHRAVSGALSQRDEAERQAREAQNQAFLAKQYRDLSSHLDRMGDKYDDFHEKVLGDDAGFTPAMRDFALTLPQDESPGSAGEVLYKLGKDPELLSRISKLHPVQQLREMRALHNSLMIGNEPRKSSPEMMGNIKSNPVSNSHNAVTERTPVSEIRARMKAGRW